MVVWEGVASNQINKHLPPLPLFHNPSALGFEPTKDELASMLAAVASPDGALDFDDFAALVAQKIATRDPVDELRKAFRLFDADETGRISFANLKRVAKELGEPLTDEELREMIDEADRDGDGEVDEAEFVRIMRKSALF